MGAQLQHYQQNRYYAGNNGALGIFRYTGTYTGLDFADFLTDSLNGKGRGAVAVAPGLTSAIGSPQREGEGPMASEFDYVIVGGGSAGCVLANRLSADPGTRVLVLEAGRPDHLWDVFIHMPAALAFPIGSRFYDWRYESEPEPFMGGRRIYHARGKVLGGSSSINGMIFQRGNPLDYERWAADPGMETWDYAHCLPYFKRMENCLAARADDPFRGHDGPLVLERGPASTPLFGAFFEAVQEAGYPLTDDVNGFRQEGFAPFDRNVHRGRRLSAARAYLHPVMGRPNLTVRTGTLVTRVVFEGTRAVGVAVATGKAGGEEVLRGGEVILSGGAINTPQLLQLSGVGDARALEPLGVVFLDVVDALGEIGERMTVCGQHGAHLRTEGTHLVERGEEHLQRVGRNHQAGDVRCDGGEHVVEDTPLSWRHVAGGRPDHLLRHARRPVDGVGSSSRRDRSRLAQHPDGARARSAH